MHGGVCVVRRRTGDLAAAEDLTSVVFLEAWRRRRSVQLTGTSLLPWLLGTAHNVCETTPVVASAPGGVAGLSVDGASPSGEDEAIARVDAQRTLSAALRELERLPHAQRDAVNLVLWCGLSYEEARACWVSRSGRFAPGSRAHAPRSVCPSRRYRRSRTRRCRRLRTRSPLRTRRSAHEQPWPTARARVEPDRIAACCDGLVREYRRAATAAVAPPRAQRRRRARFGRCGNRGRARRSAGGSGQCVRGWSATPTAPASGETASALAQ